MQCHKKIKNYERRGCEIIRLKEEESGGKLSFIWMRKLRVSHLIMNSNGNKKPPRPWLWDQKLPSLCPFTLLCFDLVILTRASYRPSILARWSECLFYRLDWSFFVVAASWPPYLVLTMWYKGSTKTARGNKTLILKRILGTLQPYPKFSDQYQNWNQRNTPEH